MDLKQEEKLNTKLLRGATQGSLRKVKKAIEAGARVDCVYTDNYRGWDSFIDTKGNSAVHEAARGGHMDILNYLLEKGAKTYVLGYDKKSPLEMAINKKKFDAALRLVDHDPKLLLFSQQGEKDLAALKRAMEKDGFGFIKGVLERELLEPIYIKTLYDYAKENGKESYVTLLQDFVPYALTQKENTAQNSSSVAAPEMVSQPVSQATEEAFVNDDHLPEPEGKRLTRKNHSETWERIGVKEVFCHSAKVLLSGKNAFLSEIFNFDRKIYTRIWNTSSDSKIEESYFSQLPPEMADTLETARQILNKLGGNVPESDIPQKQPEPKKAAVPVSKPSQS